MSIAQLSKKDALLNNSNILFKMYQWPGLTIQPVSVITEYLPKVLRLFGLLIS